MKIISPAVAWTLIASLLTSAGGAPYAHSGSSDDPRVSAFEPERIIALTRDYYCQTTLLPSVCIPEPVQQVILAQFLAEIPLLPGSDAIESYSSEDLHQAIKLALASQFFRSAPPAGADSLSAETRLEKAASLVLALGADEGQLASTHGPRMMHLLLTLLPGVNWNWFETVFDVLRAEEISRLESLLAKVVTASPGQTLKLAEVLYQVNQEGMGALGLVPLDAKQVHRELGLRENAEQFIDRLATALPESVQLSSHRLSFTAAGSYAIGETIEKLLARHAKYTVASIRSQLSPEDVRRLAGVVANMIFASTASRPHAFNDIVGHLLAEYAHHPDIRQPLAQLLEKVRELLSAELRARREHSVITSAIGDVFWVWSMASLMAGVGKGRLFTAGKGLTTLRRFRQIVSKVSADIFRAGIDPKVLKISVGVGIPYAIAKEITYQIETKRIDPLDALERIQRSLIEEKTKLMGANRRALEGMLPLEGQHLLEHQIKFKALLRQVEKDIDATDIDMADLYINAKHLKAELEPVAEDVIFCRDAVAKLYERYRNLMATSATPAVSNPVP
ncbi:MAG: hypothetical protein AB7P04_00255 [Bacteriovoracia bacterium]